MAQETLHFTCVQCPMGCPLTVTMENGEVLEVSGNTCPRGEKYGKQEAISPQRVITSLVNIAGDYHPISVKTTDAVSKAQIADIVMAIRSTTVKAPVHVGDVVIANVLGSGVDVVATSEHL